MPNPVERAEDLPRNLGNAFRDIVATADLMLAEFAGAEKQRAEGVTGAHDLLKDALGADHPRVKALEAVAVAARDRVDRLAVVNARRAKQPPPSPIEWVVTGRVRTAAGEPAAGLRVRVLDKDIAKHDVLGDTRTDDLGDFRATYHERDFAEAGEGQPELYVEVQDADGAVLYSSLETPRRPGRSEYFEIVLPPPPAMSGPAVRAPARRKDPKDKG